MIAIFVWVAVAIVASLVYAWALLRVRAQSEVRAQVMLCKHGAPKHRCLKCWLKTDDLDWEDPVAEDSDWSDPDMDRARLTESRGPGENKYVNAAYHEGVEAYGAGRPRWDNPFAHEFGANPHHELWDEGWVDAFTQRETGK